MKSVPLAYETNVVRGQPRHDADETQDQTRGHLNSCSAVYAAAASQLAALLNKTIFNFATWKYASQNSCSMWQQKMLTHPANYCPDVSSGPCTCWGHAEICAHVHQKQLPRSRLKAILETYPTLVTQVDSAQLRHFMRQQCASMSQTHELGDVDSSLLQLACLLSKKSNHALKIILGHRGKGNKAKVGKYHWH